MPSLRGSGGCQPCACCIRKVFGRYCHIFRALRKHPSGSMPKKNLYMLSCRLPDAGILWRVRYLVSTLSHSPPDSACAVQDKPQFWKRKPSIMKCHMLILAHLARADIPKSLRSDYAAIMKKCPLFLEEMINIANIPRPPAVRLQCQFAQPHPRPLDRVSSTCRGSLHSRHV